MLDAKADLFPCLSNSGILKGAVIIDMPRDTCAPCWIGVPVKHQYVACWITDDDADRLMIAIDRGLQPSYWFAVFHSKHHFAPGRVPEVPIDIEHKHLVSIKNFV